MAKRPQIKSWIIKHWKLIKEKSPILFTTSGAPADDPQLLTWYEEAFPGDIRKVLEYYPLGGRMIFNQLTWLGRTFMKIGQHMERDPEIKSKMLTDVDRMDKDALKPIVESLIY